jgi:hypothetical protein
MEPTGSALRERARELDRIARPLDDLRIVASLQPDGSVAEHVDGRDNLERAVFPAF